MSWNGLSHISSSRYQYRFTGSEFLSIPDNSTLDITQSFSLGFMMKPEPSVRQTYALWCKGHPSDPTQGSFFIESINGFLWIYLHDGTQNKSLVYYTPSPVINTNRIIYLEVVWDYTYKQLKLYENAVEVGLVQDTTNPNYFTSSNNMGLLTVTSDNLEFGRALGKIPFIGTVYDYIYLSRARSSGEIFTYYDSIKYTGSYPNTGKIVFTSNRENSGRQDIYTMDGDFTDPQLIYSGVRSITHPIFWSDDGTAIATVDSSGWGYIMAADGGDVSTNNTTDGNYGYLSASFVSGSNNSIISCKNTTVVSSTRTMTRNFRSGASLTTPGATNWTVGFGVSQARWRPGSARDILLIGRAGTSSTTQYYLSLMTLSSDYNPSASGATYSTLTGISFASEVPSTNPALWSYRDINWNKQGTKIGYSFKPKIGIYANTFNVYIINPTGGLNQQCTFETEPGAHHRFMCFSPDGDKVLISKYNPSTSKNQIWCYDFDSSTNTISNGINISNNTFNDMYADWKA